jgi:hypothetical protein
VDEIEIHIWLTSKTGNLPHERLRENLKAYWVISFAKLLFLGSIFWCGYLLAALVIDSFVQYSTSYMWQLHEAVNSING